MKINFNEAFRELKRVVDSSAKPTELPKSTKSFSKLLSSIAPERAQSPEKTTLSEANKSLKGIFSEPGEMPMASFRFAPPEMKTPSINPLEIQGPISEPVNNPTLGVKTPSILSVKKLSSQAHETAEERSARINEVAKLVANAGQKHGIDPELGIAVVAAESSFNPAAVSTDGHSSKGLMQLLDTTGADLLKKVGLSEKYDPFNPEQNVDLGVGYLRHLHEIFSTDTELPGGAKTFAAANSSSLEKLAVAAFNAGEGRVASAQERAKKAGLNPADYDAVEKYLPETTQEYVAKVMSSKGALKGNFEG